MSDVSRITTCSTFVPRASITARMTMRSTMRAMESERMKTKRSNPDSTPGKTFITSESVAFNTSRRNMGRASARSSGVKLGKMLGRNA